MPSARSKRAGRELALLCAYAVDTHGDTRTLDDLLDGGERGGPKAENLDALRAVPGAGAFARRLVEGYQAHAAEVDAVIERISARWRLSRMDRIDRSILRLAATEQRLDPSLPTGVLLSQWVELAGRYGSERSARFVNGLLRTLVTGGSPAGGRGT